MMTDDPFHILGLTAGAPRDEIRRAYRKLAMRWHPDRNPHSWESAERFKRIKAAHDLALDPEAYREWQRERHSTAAPPDPQSAPCEWPLNIPLEIAVHGGQQTVTVTASISCAPCAGSGRIEQAHSVPCARCHGIGRLRGASTSVSAICPDCTGRGYVRHGPCTRCQGVGSAETRRTYTVKVPPGRRDGDTLRLAPEGNPVLLRVALEPHSLFSRSGDDLHGRVPVDCLTWVGGGEIDVPTLEGMRAVSLPAPALDAAIRIPNAGLSRSDGSRGTLILTLEMIFPTHLTGSDAKSLRRLGESLRRNGALPQAWHDWQHTLERWREGLPMVQE